MTRSGPLARPSVDRARHPEWFHITTTSTGAPQINISLLRMPPPDRSLMANITAVSRRDRSIEMVFGQMLPGGRKMNGALVVVMSSTMLQQALYASEDFLRSVENYAQRHKIAPTMRTPGTVEYPDERVVLERASLVAISFAEDEAELRFFRLSPTDVRALTHVEEGSEKVDVVYPVVQVMLDTSELVHLFHSLTQLVPREHA